MTRVSGGDPPGNFFRFFNFMMAGRGWCIWNYFFNIFVHLKLFFPFLRGVRGRSSRSFFNFVTRVSGGEHPGNFFGFCSSKTKKIHYGSVVESKIFKSDVRFRNNDLHLSFKVWSSMEDLFSSVTLERNCPFTSLEFSDFRFCSCTNDEATKHHVKVTVEKRLASYSYTDE